MHKRKDSIRQAVVCFRYSSRVCGPLHLPALTIQIVPEVREIRREPQTARVEGPDHRADSGRSCSAIYRNPFGPYAIQKEARIIRCAMIFGLAPLDRMSS